ncbi:MAG: hypothetical protein K2X27_12515, partial [Candidatus Obscuribacterales bacterium]|nr:hypothetical protein [Candidatus Obscuribacterales bacterium]
MKQELIAIISGTILFVIGGGVFLTKATVKARQREAVRQRLQDLIGESIDNSSGLPVKAGFSEEKNKSGSVLNLKTNRLWLSLEKIHAQS